MKAEIKIQAECFLWFHNSFPQYRGLLCYNLNNSRNAIDGNMNKSLGLQKGRSDMVLYFNTKAIMLEFKNDVGTQSRDQKEWEKQITSQGFEYHVIRSLEQFKELINKKLEI